jgi:unsaturated pyranuronate lyase
MFRKKSPDGYIQVLDKIERKTLVYGEKMLMCEFRLRRGAVLSRHSHPHEQTGYLVSGRMELTIGDQSSTLVPGDSWCIAGGVEHNASALEDSLALEVFAPIREDYLT